MKEKNTPPYYELGGNIKVYKALLNQSGTDAPVATVLQNTLGESLVFNYLNTGAYNIISNGRFRVDKTSVSVTNVSAGCGYGEPAGDGNEIYLFSQNGSGTQVNGYFYVTLIEITVYP